jgi:hypothetical protein
MPDLEQIEAEADKRFPVPAQQDPSEESDVPAACQGKGGTEGKSNHTAPCGS